jgi:hypothetical protein
MLWLCTGMACVKPFGVLPADRPGDSQKNARGRLEFGPARNYNVELHYNSAADLGGKTHAPDKNLTQSSSI